MLIDRRLLCTIFTIRLYAASERVVRVDEELVVPRRSRPTALFSWAGRAKLQRWLARPGVPGRLLRERRGTPAAWFCVDDSEKQACGPRPDALGKHRFESLGAGGARGAA